MSTMRRRVEIENVGDGETLRIAVKGTNLISDSKCFCWLSLAALGVLEVLSVVRLMCMMETIPGEREGRRLLEPFVGYWGDDLAVRPSVLACLSR
jgi:hypothetical protein